MDILDQISKGAQSAGEFLTEKAILAKDYTLHTWDITKLRNRINTLYKAIGRASYKAYKTESSAAEEIDLYFKELDLLFPELRAKQEARQALRGRKLCPACEKPIEEFNAFCPHCGAKIK